MERQQQYTPGSDGVLKAFWRSSGGHVEDPEGLCSSAFTKVETLFPIRIARVTGNDLLCNILWSGAPCASRFRLEKTAWRAHNADVRTSLVQWSRTTPFVFTAVLAVGFFCEASGQSNNLGRISGSVVADDGSEVPDAAIRISQMPQYERRGHRFVSVGSRVGRTAKASNGEFDFRDLPAGDYQICVFARGFLDTCRWPDKNFVRIGSESRDLDKQITLQKGSIVQIIVEDPGGHMGASDARFDGSEVRLGAQAPNGTVHLGNIVAREPGRLTCEVAVPFDMPMKRVSQP